MLILIFMTEHLSNPWVLWAVIATVLVILEVFITDLTSLILGIGAAVASATAALNGPLWLQFLLAGAAAFTLFIFVRPIVRKKLEPSDDVARMGPEKLVGKTAMVVDHNKVEVDHSGLELWSAEAENGDPLVPGQKVLVKKIDSSKLIVSLVENGETK
jgi:membrane protein implicated in regulation of membrane protease activity